MDSIPDRLPLTDPNRFPYYILRLLTVHDSRIESTDRRIKLALIKSMLIELTTTRFGVNQLITALQV
jgi:hypothetical protein